MRYIFRNITAIQCVGIVFIVILLGGGLFVSYLFTDNMEHVTIYEIPPLNLNIKVTRLTRKKAKIQFSKNKEFKDNYVIQFFNVYDGPFLFLCNDTVKFIDIRNSTKFKSETVNIKNFAVELNFPSPFDTRWKQDSVFNQAKRKSDYYIKFDGNMNGLYVCDQKDSIVFDTNRPERQTVPYTNYYFF